MIALRKSLICRKNFFVFLVSSISLGAPDKTFKFHIVNEPSSLKPWEQKNSNSGYMLSQIVGTLLSYQDHKIQSNLAQKCHFVSPLKVECLLKKDLKWSNNSPIQAVHFVKAFQKFIDPINKAPQAELLFSVKNAEKIFKGEVKPEFLGVKAVNNQKLRIDLEKQDTDFLYTLTSPLLGPLPTEDFPTTEELKKSPQKWVSSGAYQIAEWNPPSQIRLNPNPHFWKKNLRPPIEIQVIPEDSVALSLYEKNELDFLRRLPTLLIPKFKGTPDFNQIEQYRFDYIGFSPKHRENLSLRRAISRSIQYKELQNLFHSPGLPGCPGIPSHLLNQEDCLKFDPVEGMSEWSNLRGRPTKIEIQYSRQGGDDHRRNMEWLQSELKKNLKIESEASGLDNQIFIDKLITKPADLFRKGIAPQRPTCHSALKAFLPNSPENYTQFSDPKYEEILEALSTTRDESKRKKLCSDAIHLLLKDFWIIPTGPIHFTLLVKPQWKNWKLNELNQLDLSELSSN